MKKAFIFFSLFVAMPLMAQNGNAQQNVSVGELSYMIKEQPKSGCKVVSGGKDIKAALDAGEQLLIISTD